MKKISIGILAVLYLTVSSGVAMNIHHCMGKIYSVGLFGHTDKCGKCGMKSGHGSCCSDQFKIVKLDDSHILSSNDINIFTPVAVFNHSASLVSNISYGSIITDRKGHSPPWSSQSSLCILHCVFRI